MMTWLSALKPGPEPREGWTQVMQALAAWAQRPPEGPPALPPVRRGKAAVAIAAVLSLTPAILVMDEPSSNLDPKTRRQLIELLKTFEHSLIIATHDLDLVWTSAPHHCAQGGRIGRRPHPGDHADEAFVRLQPGGPSASCPVYPGLTPGHPGPRSSLKSH
jgi:hypothetical protein